MKEKAGQVFSLAADNPPIPGCTTSRCVKDGDCCVTYFSLAESTDISPEIFPYAKLLIPASGTLLVSVNGSITQVPTGNAFLAPADLPVGMQACVPTVYTEITIRRNSFMNSVIKPGEVFSLAALVPVQEGKIVNMDVTHNDTMKLALMAFAPGTGLSDHAAPGEALIFALEGEAVIRYEGQEHVIHAGENFHFAKGGMHAVRADQAFKMALLLTLA